MFNFWIPACAAAAAFIALALGWAAVEAFIDDRGPMSPGLPRLAIVLAVVQAYDQVIWV